MTPKSGGLAQVFTALQRVVVGGLVLLAGACAESTESTEPDLRSARALEGSGKPVWDTYVLTVDLEPTTYPPFPLLVDYVDTVRFDAAGVLTEGGPYLPPDAFRTAIEPFPFEKGDTVSLRIVWWRGGYWVRPPFPDYDRVPCSSETEEAFYNSVFPWSGADCEFAESVVTEYLTGVVQPNGRVTGVDSAYQSFTGDLLVGTFTLSPIRGNRDIAVEPVITYELLETRTLEVDPIYPEPYVYRLNIQVMVAALANDSVTTSTGDRYALGTPVTTSEQYLDFTVPEGCVRVGGELRCTDALVLPTEVVVTILPGAQWYEAPTGEPVVADFTNETVTVTVVGI